MDAIVASLGKTDYAEVLEVQRELNRLRNLGRIPDTIIFNEHSDVYTVGIHRNPEEVLDPGIQPIPIERGGSITYHGPGQLVVYFVLSLMERKTNIKVVIESVQEAINSVLLGYGIKSHGRLSKETGVWVDDRKICSIGFAIKESSTLHGIGLNVTTDLGAFSRIMPCGYTSSVMTSIEKESNMTVKLDEVQSQLKKELLRILGMDNVREINGLEDLKKIL